MINNYLKKFEFINTNNIKYNPILDLSDFIIVNDGTVTSLNICLDRMPIIGDVKYDTIMMQLEYWNGAYWNGAYWSPIM